MSQKPDGLELSLGGRRENGKETNISYPGRRNGCSQKTCTPNMIHDHCLHVMTSIQLVGNGNQVRSNKWTIQIC